ncbi:MAG: hypothetical protein ABI887_17850 [Burkholderiales bacterium]
MRTEIPSTEPPHGLVGWHAESWVDTDAASELRAASTSFARHSFLASLAFTAAVVVVVVLLPAYV